MAAYKKKGFSNGIALLLIMMFSQSPTELSEIGCDVAAVPLLKAATL